MEQASPRTERESRIDVINAQIQDLEADIETLKKKKPMDMFGDNNGEDVLGQIQGIKNRISNLVLERDSL